MKNRVIGIVVIMAFALTAINACKKQKANNCSAENVTITSIQGNWKQDYPKQEPDFSHPDQYNLIRFTDDSFYLAVTHRSDMLYANGCNEVLWTEYTKGKYNLTPGRLYFNGIYTEADYSEKTEGCYNIGAYADSFSVKYCNPYLVLYGLSPALSNSVDRTINLAKE